jgi:hypothetical protein
LTPDDRRGCPNERENDAVHIGFEEILILSLTMAIVGIIIALDASRLPEAAFTDVGTTRLEWQIGPIILAFVTIGFGTFVAMLVWTSGRRREVTDAAAARRAAEEPADPSESEESADPAEPAAEPAQ